MRKPQDSTPLPADDPAFVKARQEWDSRLEEAAARERRSFIFGCLGGALGLAGFGYGMWERGRVLDPVVRYVEKCRDQLLAVVSADMPGELNAQDISDKLKAWARGAREVSTDAAHMRRAVWNTYNMTEGGSQAEAALRAYHEQKRPTDRARDEIVVLERLTAMPDGVASSRAWKLEWREVTTGRDGRRITAEDWRMGLTFTVRRPTTTEEIERNWSGIFVNAFHWEKLIDPRVALGTGAGR